MDKNSLMHWDRSNPPLNDLIALLLVSMRVFPDDRLPASRPVSSRHELGIRRFPNVDVISIRQRCLRLK